MNVPGSLTPSVTAAGSNYDCRDWRNSPVLRPLESVMSGKIVRAYNLRVRKTAASLKQASAKSKKEFCEYPRPTQTHF